LIALCKPTDPEDLVVDIFAGSNTTGQVAEVEGRRWLSFELSREYAAASVFRFLDKDVSAERVQVSHELIMAGGSVALDQQPRQAALAL
jgi:DNA modification methylase